jgi:hypothetical protein
MLVVINAATLVIYYLDFKMQVGSNHFLVKHMGGISTKFAVNSAGQKQWSEEIRWNWKFNKRHSMVYGDETEVVGGFQVQ